MRARNVKPSLFKNELLATSDPLYAWIFEGLWCMADREGRLEDRPRKIHLEVNAGRAFEGTETALAWLAENGFIARYTSQGIACIEVLAFHKHQKPHPREAPSELPAREVAPRQDPGMTKALPSPALSPIPLPESPIPIPLSSLSPRESAREKRPKASKRVPEDFEVTQAMRDWATLEAPHTDIEAETKKFRDHQFREGRSDWTATWRQWMRRAPEFRGNGIAKPPAPVRTWKPDPEEDERAQS